MRLIDCNMSTILCAEIIGPFGSNSLSMNSSSTYIEIPDSNDTLDQNKLKQNYYMQNKYNLLKKLNITIADEQPIPPGIFIILSLHITDNDITQILDSNFLGYNVENKNNNLNFYLRSLNQKQPEKKKIIMKCS